MIKTATRRSRVMMVGINADYRQYKNYQFQIHRRGDYGGITPEKAVTPGFQPENNSL
jgi:hypothetical protein